MSSCRDKWLLLYQLSSAQRPMLSKRKPQTHRTSGNSANLVKNYKFHMRVCGAPQHNLLQSKRHLCVPASDCYQSKLTSLAQYAVIAQTSPPKMCSKLHNHIHSSRRGAGTMYITIHSIALRAGFCNWVWCLRACMQYALSHNDMTTIHNTVPILRDGMPCPMCYRLLVYFTFRWFQYLYVCRRTRALLRAHSLTSLIALHNSPY